MAPVINTQLLRAVNEEEINQYVRLSFIYCIAAWFIDNFATNAEECNDLQCNNIL